MELQRTQRVTVARSTGSDPTLRDFERLAELLRLDAVGVAVQAGDDKRVQWWGAPGCALPDPLDDLLAGAVPGWLVTPLPDGAQLFAKLTSDSSVRAPAVLQAIGPLLASAASSAGALPQPGQEQGSLSSVEAALAELREDLGFETASLFVRGAGGWELLARRGPVRAWHAVLEPSALEGTPEAAEYPDVRAIPGVGSRLAGLGCASVASLPIPQGGRVLLDSAIPCPEGGWVERARPFLALLSIMAGPGWAAGPVLRTYQEVAVLNNVFAAIQETLERPGAAVEDLLESVREAMLAQELFVLAARDADVHVMAAPSGGWPRRLPDRFKAVLTPTGEPAMEDDVIRKLCVALGVPSKAVGAAFGRQEGRVEALLAGWADGLGLSPVSMAVVARAVSTARVALLARRQAVSALMDRERTRMAYALHDGLVQTVTSAVLELEALRRRFERDPTEALGTLETAKAEIRRSLAELRSMMFDLSNRPSEDGGSTEPITEYVEDVVRRWRLPARVSVQGAVNDVPPRVLSVAYVVIREALANAAKHAATGNVTVRLAAAGGELAVSVHDGGRGFTSEDERTARQAHHFGLEMLRRRVREAGGELTIESTPGTGTEILARIPVEESRR